MPDARDLTTVANVKALMQKSGVNAGTQDSLIQTEITRASVKIMRDYGREFVPGGTESLTSTGATRTFEYDRGEQYGGETFVDLAPYDLTASTPTITVAVDTDSDSPLTLLSTQWRAWPRPASNGVFMAIKISITASRGYYPYFSHRQIQVTGNWGFPSVPPEAAQACEETVIHWITAYPAARRVDAGETPLAPVMPRSLPMTAVDLLRSFQRVSV